MNEIVTWLNSERNYTTGVELYRKYGNNSILMVLFGAANTSLSRRQLVDELTKLSTKIKDAPIAQKKATHQYRSAPTPEEKNKWPQPVIDWQDRRITCLKVLDNLKPKIMLARSKKKRYEICLQMDDIEIEADALLTKINYFRDNGIVPAADGFDVDAMTHTQLAMQRKNIPSYIAKINTRLKDENLHDMEVSELVMRKKEWENKFNLVKQKLHAL